MGSVESKKTAQGYIRRANYAGSWYEAQESALDEVLTKYLSDASSDSTDEEHTGRVRGLVAPHAGYAYSGPTAAYAYRALVHVLQTQQDVSTILVLHPSHYVYLDGCAVSGASIIETPLGNISVDQELQKEILKSPKFTTMTKSTDEQEHSGELQYPYIAKACKDASRTCSILPIMVGSLNEAQTKSFGTLLAHIVARPNIVTVVSSDFCHWGSRFQYTPFDSQPDIFSKIKDMDWTGMTHIEMQEPGAFAKYLQHTSNTICGRHPIGVWLHAVKHNKDSSVETLNVKFVRYAQSSQVRSKSDSSVSYASAVARQAS